MTASELRELDAWIEEHLFGREVVIQEREDLPTIYKFKLELEYELVPVHAYSTSVISFALVKREIERKEWFWQVEKRPEQPAFSFKIFDGTDAHGLIGWAYSDTEELVGCLAVKAAVERKP